MNREQIIQWAKAVGIEIITIADAEIVERFAALVAADMKERCAKVCDSVNNYDNPMTALDCADAIRALEE